VNPALLAGRLGGHPRPGLVFRLAARGQAEDLRFGGDVDDNDYVEIRRALAFGEEWDFVDDDRLLAACFALSFPRGSFSAGRYFGQLDCLHRSAVPAASAAGRCQPLGTNRSWSRAGQRQWAERRPHAEPVGHRLA